MDLYTLTNRDGLVAKITNLGGHVTELQVPDRNGHMADIVLGHSTLDPYLDRRTNPYFGSIVGRYANRIAKGKFTLDGKQYTLDASSGGNHLHGGKVGFDLKVWDADWMPDNPEGPALRLTYSSPDGEEGYPGQLDTTVVYTLTHDNALTIDYRATDRQADGGEPDQPLLLQPLRRGVGRHHHRPCARTERRPLHRGR